MSRKRIPQPALMQKRRSDYGWVTYEKTTLLLESFDFGFSVQSHNGGGELRK